MLQGRDSVLRSYALLAAMVIASAAGCTRQSGPAVDDLLKASGQSKMDVCPLAGRLTIDGHGPDADGKADLKHRIIIVAHSADNLDAPVSGLGKVICKPNGEFAFSMYGGEKDGLPTGKYVLTVAKLLFDRKRGYVGPDRLKNLYNDPEKNSRIPEFVVDLQPPGKTDYVIELQVDGRDPVTPGPKAVTAFR
jgi:hypothetical protein